MSDQSRQSLGHKLDKVWQFVSLLTLEPYIFMFYIMNAIKGVPSGQLTQDKICLNQFHLSSNYCYALPTMSATDDYLNKKSEVLAEATNFSIYGALFMTLPSLFGGFLIGPWTDKYPMGKKIILMAGSLTGIMEALILILNDYYYYGSK